MTTSHHPILMVPPSADMRLVRAQPIIKKEMSEGTATNRRRSGTANATAADNIAIVQVIDPAIAIPVIGPLFQ
jgi:hypothetical protein